MIRLKVTVGPALDACADADTVVTEIQAENVLEALRILHEQLNDVAMPRRTYSEILGMDYGPKTTVSC